MFRGKSLLTGILAGVLISMPIHMYANDIKTKVETWATPYVQFIFDDQITPLPLGYTVLNYEGRTYVPTRFVAEQLGAEVDWDESTQTIFVKSKPIPEPVPEEPGKGQQQEENKNDNEEQQEEKITYNKLPVKKTYKDFSLTTTSVFKDNNATRVYVELENKQSRPLQIRQLSATLVIEGKTYKANIAGILDERLFKDAREDEFLEGYLTFPAIPKDADKATVKLELIYNDGSGDKEELEYNIKF